MLFRNLRQQGDRLFPWLVFSALLHLMLLLGVGFRPHPSPEQLPAQPIEVELSPTAGQDQANEDADEKSTASSPKIPLPLNAADSEHREARNRTETLPRNTDMALDLPSGQERFLTADSRSTIHQQYIEIWRRKVERVGNLNYPPEARDQHLNGSLVLDVSLRPDGSLADIAVLQSSGIPLLDAAARRFVEMAAPFAPFPPELKGNAKVLHIIRTLNFRAGEVY